MSTNNKKYKITVVGLGYVGLPLAIELSKKFTTIGYDINELRLSQLRKHVDSTNEISSEELKKTSLIYTSNKSDIGNSNIYIVTVPTPVNQNNHPDLTPLVSASKLVGENLNKGDIVIYESTVYPGCTEEDCVPVLESSSGLKYKKDFCCGYSPERINPGDSVRTVTNITKIVSGTNSKTLSTINYIYSQIIKAGTYKASSIKVAEAAKVIENSQRDINIAFVNELAKIFHKIDIDTLEVLEAASTKWNFLHFKPGLVGGHCIGVDPYYLAQKAIGVGYNPEIILAGRRMNDSMGPFIAQEVIKLMISKSIPLKNSKTLILGFTFKENCPDTRNTKIIDIYKELVSFNLTVDLYDPLASYDEVYKKFGIKMKKKITGKYDSIIFAVSHDKFKNIDLDKIKKSKSVIYDVKGVLDKKNIDKRL